MTRLIDRRRLHVPGVPSLRGQNPPPAAEHPRVRGIRRRRAGDIAACGRLLEVVHYDAHYPALRPEPPRAWLDHPDVHAAWVAERRAQILGHVAVSAVALDSLSALRWRETTGHQPSDLLAVSRFFVRPAARGQGIGTALLGMAVAEIRGRGRVPVLEMISSRRDGISFVAERGWRLIAMDPWGSAEGDLQMYRYAAPPEPAAT